MARRSAAKPRPKYIADKTASVDRHPQTTIRFGEVPTIKDGPPASTTDGYATTLDLTVCHGAAAFQTADAVRPLEWPSRLLCRALGPELRPKPTGAPWMFSSGSCRNSLDRRWQPAFFPRQRYGRGGARGYASLRCVVRFVRCWRVEFDVVDFLRPRHRSRVFVCVHPPGSSTTLRIRRPSRTVEEVRTM